MASMPVTSATTGDGERNGAFLRRAVGAIARAAALSAGAQRARRHGRTSSDIRANQDGRASHNGHASQASSASHARGDGRGLELVLSGAPTRRWFERRALVIGAVVFSSVAIFLVRELVSSHGEMLGLLYVIPVALVGLELGLRAGVAGSLAALLLLAVRRPSGDPTLDALGLSMRGVALLSVGAIAGRFSDRMRDAQTRMHEHFRSAEHILGVHERERRGIAEQLHEQAAQAMAAALLLVGRQSQAVDPLQQARVDEVRDSVRDCIGHLRELAARLRPSVLDELGLAPALERIVESRETADRLSIEPGSDAVSDRLPPDTETLAYRVIDEILACLSGAISLRMTLTPHALRVEIAGRQAPRMQPHETDLALATTQARLRIIGGSMSSSLADERMAVDVELPVPCASPSPPGR